MKALKFSLKSLFSSFSISLFVSLFFEMIIFKLFLNYTKIKDFKFSILSVLLTAVFLSNIFSKDNIINFLFINGLDRKKISMVKILSVFIYNLIYFLIYILFKFIFTDSISHLYEINQIIKFTVIFIAINFVSEISIYITLLYRRLSIREGKGVVKVFYKYYYSVIFFFIVYCTRLFSRYFFESEHNILMLLIFLVFSIALEILLIYINRKHILNIDIRS